MSGVVCQVINYYGLLHLSYYSSIQFLEKSTNIKMKPTPKDSKDKNIDLPDDESSEEEYKQLYLWLSKWVVFISYIYIEPYVVSLLEFIPGLYFISLILKFKLLSTNSAIHDFIFSKTYGHLQEFDIFDFVWKFSSNQVVSLIVGLNKLAGYFFSKLSVEQLHKLEGAYKNSVAQISTLKQKAENKDAMRMSKIITRSSIFDKSRGVSQKPKADKSKSPVPNRLGTTTK